MLITQDSYLIWLCAHYCDRCVFRVNVTRLTVSAAHLDRYMTFTGGLKSQQILSHGEKHVKSSYM